nr:immunoglobulin heavy chain junction region [Macaca mulatta]
CAKVTRGRTLKW